MIALLLAAAISVEAGWGACRPADGPLAVLVDASNPGPGDVAGRLVIADVRRNTIELPVDLAPGAHKRWRVALPSAGSLASVDWEADRGDAPQITRESRPGCSGASLAILERAGGTGVRFPSGADSKGAFSLGRVMPEDLDAPWQVLESLDAIEAEARALSELSDARFFALRTWVLTGGLLIVVPGNDPAPLAKSGRLPSTVDLLGVLSETAWGEGAVVFSPELAPDAGGIVAASIRSRVLRAQVDRSAARAARALVRRSIESETGPGAMGGGTGLVALASLAGALLVAHEIYRRRRVVKASGLRTYAGFVAGGIATLSASSFLVARIAAGEVRGGGVRIIADGSSVGRLVVAVPLLPGDSAPIAPDAFPEADGDTQVTIGTPIRLATAGSVARTASSVAAWDGQGAVTVRRVTGGWRIENGTRVALGAGTLVDRVSSYEVPALASGAAADLVRTMRLKAEIRLLAPFESDGPVYIAPAEEGWIIVRVQENR